MKHFASYKHLFLSVAILAIASCGKYPNVGGLPDVHDSPISGDAGAAEMSGEGYEPKFLAPGYKTLNVDFEIKETIADLGGGFKYRALTYDGNFPAKTIVAEQNTLVRIKIKNNDSAPHGIHTHVIKYTPGNDGVGKSQTEAKSTRYYFWEVTNATPVGFYPFHDHGGDNEGAQARGLIGMISIVKQGETANPGFGVLLHDLDPAFLYSVNGTNVNGSAGHAGGHGSSAGTPMAIPAHLVNGRFGAAPESSFSVAKGQKIRIGVVNLGSQIHTFHTHGNSWPEADGRLNDNLELLPGGFRTIELNADAAGTWLYHCHVSGHPEGGMWGQYVVTE